MKGLEIEAHSARPQNRKLSHAEKGLRTGQEEGINPEAGGGSILWDPEGHHEGSGSY